MPLQIKDASPSSIASINRWAAQQEARQNVNEKRIEQLRQILQNLTQNLGIPIPK